MDADHTREDILLHALLEHLETAELRLLRVAPTREAAQRAAIQITAAVWRLPPDTVRHWLACAGLHASPPGGDGTPP